MNDLFLEISQNTNVFFVRHAETEYNSQHIIAGRAETPLTEKGISQAIQTGKFLSQFDISIALSSPLTRTRHTTDLMLQQNHNDIPLFIDGNLIEVETGVFTHKKIADIESQDPDSYSHFKKYSWEKVDKAERIFSLIKRCKKIWNQIIEKANQGHKNILVVSHGGFLQWIFKTSFSFYGPHTQTWAPVVRSANCGVYQLVLEPVYTKEGVHDGIYSFWQLLNHICYN